MRGKSILSAHEVMYRIILDLESCDCGVDGSADVGEAVKTCPFPAPEAPHSSWGVPSKFCNSTITYLCRLRSTLLMTAQADDSDQKASCRRHMSQQ
jgi:hypothetical protein